MKRTRKLVIIESPYAGDVERNTTYARACVKDSLLRGEAPLASHLLYTQPGILNDSIPSERARGIRAGLAWLSSADLVAIYTDLGMSKGMTHAMAKAIDLDVKVELRSIIKKETP